MARLRRDLALFAVLAAFSACDNPVLVAARATGDISSAGMAGDDSPGSSSGSLGGTADTETGAGQASLGGEGAAAGKGGTGGDVAASGAGGQGPGGNGATAGDSTLGGVTGLAGDTGLAGSTGQAGDTGVGGDPGIGGSTGVGGDTSVGGATGQAGDTALAGAAGSAGAGGSDGCALSFQVHTQRTYGGIPASIAAVDLNQGTYPDIVVTGLSSALAVALPWFDNNDGDGTIAAAQHIDVPYGLSVFVLAAADLNGDGLPDLAVTDNGDTGSAGGVRIFLNNGDATFAPPPVYLTGDGPRALAIGDIDRANGPDLAVAVGAYVYLFTNQGDGTFSDPTIFAVVGDPVYVHALAIADLDDDLWPDLVAAIPYGMRVFSNAGDGSFGAQDSYVAGMAGPTFFESPKSVAPADLDGDGDLDITVGNYGSTSGSAGVFLNDGLGTFAAQVRYPISANTQGATVASGDLRAAIADLDRDGSVDIALPTYGGDTVALLMGDGDGTFGAEVPVSAGLFPDAVVASDLDLDGFPDLAVASNDVGGVDGAVMALFSECK